MNDEFIYISPKYLKDIDFKVNIPTCSCPWYAHWIPFRKHKYKTIKVCPVTDLEMKLEVVQIALKLLPEHTDRDKMLFYSDELIEKIKDTKCTCQYKDI